MLDTMTPGAPDDIVDAFVCGHSGLYFPTDYCSEWGKKHGHGLGPHPVSIVEDTQYHNPPSLVNVKAEWQIMHPVEVCAAPVSRVKVKRSEYEANKAILPEDDEDGRLRYAILMENQMAHKQSMVPMMRAQVKVVPHVR